MFLLHTVRFIGSSCRACSACTRCCVRASGVFLYSFFTRPSENFDGCFLCFAAVLLDELLAREVCSLAVVAAFSLLALLAALSPCVDTLGGTKAVLSFVRKLVVCELSTVPPLSVKDRILSVTASFVVVAVSVTISVTSLYLKNSSSRPDSHNFNLSL